jgi:hypothetical protein
MRPCGGHGAACKRSLPGVNNGLRGIVEPRRAASWFERRVNGLDEVRVARLALVIRASQGFRIRCRRPGAQLFEEEGLRSGCGCKCIRLA